jgi:thioredoxin-dependent adenylylsulfate APS reductase
MIQAPIIDDLAISALDDRFSTAEPQAILAWALQAFPAGRVALCTSFQSDGMALLDMAWRIDPQVRVFTIDTGMLPQETLDLIDRVEQRYGITVEVHRPDRIEVGEMTGEHGETLFYEATKLRLLCCDVRKVRPLRRVLTTMDAWITGLRRDQYNTRSAIHVVERDTAHDDIVKINPLANWTEEQVWSYIRTNDVPYHALYDQGYTSIGCAPCTRAIKPGESARAGRWWWETDAPKECGMHCAIEIGSSGSAKVAPPPQPVTTH